MTVRNLTLVLIAAGGIAACSTPWREEASADAMGCVTKDIVISDPQSGSLNNSWKATCHDRTFNCVVPAAADPNTPAKCTPDAATAAKLGIAPATAPTAAPSIVTAPMAPATQADLDEKLQVLERAYALGLLTEQEYKAKRAALAGPPSR